MDLDLLMIFSFVFALAVLALSMAHIFHRHEERKLELAAQTDAAKRGPDADAFRKLEERVRVLERIATDGKANLAVQIEQLRDLHEIEEFTADREKAQ